MASENLLVKDDEYLTVEYKAKKYGAFLAESCAYYNKILQYIVTNAVKDQLISDGFNGILEQVLPIPDRLTTWKDDMSSSLGTYMQEIDEADSFLYGER